MNEPIKVLYIIDITEHERGWGQRPDGHIGCLTEAAADEYIKRKTTGRTGHAPDIYESYSKRGYVEVSPTVYMSFASTNAESMYFDKLSELKK